MATELVDVRLRYKGNDVTKITTSADPKSTDDLEHLFHSLLKRDPSADRRDPIDYEIVLYRAGTRQELQTYTGRAR